MTGQSATAGVAATDGSLSGGVVLMISEGAMGMAVANHMRRVFPDVTVLVEEPEAKSVILKRRARLLGWHIALGQACAGVLHKLIARRSASRIDRLCRSTGLDCKPEEARRFRRIASVNSEACRAALCELQPAVIAVYGTRIIRRDTLRAVAAPFINYHAGINPKYRGQHPGYWALVNGDPEHAGVTVHLVDEGVDTGGVLYQAKVDFQPDDNITTYQWRQMAIALPLLVRAVEDGLARRLAPHRVELPSAQHFPPTVWAYAWYGATRGVW